MTTRFAFFSLLFFLSFLGFFSLLACAFALSLSFDFLAFLAFFALSPLSRSVTERLLPPAVTRRLPPRLPELLLCLLSGLRSQLEEDLLFRTTAADRGCERLLLLGLDAAVLLAPLLPRR